MNIIFPYRHLFQDSSELYRRFENSRIGASLKVFVGICLEDDIMISNDDKLLVAKMFFKSIIPYGIPKKAFFEDKICLKVFRNR